jgi:hypothetical protein
LSDGCRNWAVIAARLMKKKRKRASVPSPYRNMHDAYTAMYRAFRVRSSRLRICNKMDIRHARFPPYIRRPTPCACVRSLHLTVLWHWHAARDDTWIEGDVHALPRHAGATACAAASLTRWRDHVAAAHVAGIPPPGDHLRAARAGGRPGASVQLQKRRFNPSPSPSPPLRHSTCRMWGWHVRTLDVKAVNAMISVHDHS